MRTGKISEAILNRSVLKEIKYTNDSVIHGPGSGCDASVVKIAGISVAVSSNPVMVDGETESYVGISRVMNDVAVKGAVPKAITAVFILPTGFTESRLKKLMRRIDECCAANDVVLLGGHTEVSELVKAPCVIYTCIGEGSDWQAQIRPGQEVIMTGVAGVEGAFVITGSKREEILSRYTESFFDKCKMPAEELFLTKTIELARKAGATYVHNLSAGGVFNGLWELASYGNVGLDIDLKKIPVRQEIIELCELFELNPYQLASGGSLLMTSDCGCDIVNILKSQGIQACCIGRVTAQNERVIRNDDEIRYLDEPKPDELLKIR